MDRQPVVAGQFYPGQKAGLEAQVRRYLRLGARKAERPTLLAMVPHAGYIYSGGVAGKTLAQADLARTILLLGPNHTGRGSAFAVWPDGVWRVPGADTEVDEELARALMAAEPRLVADQAAHLHEHSLEVVLPFIQAVRPGARVVPMAVAEPRLLVLGEVARNMAGVLKGWPEPVSMVVSSDMSHYVTHETAKERDMLALDAVRELDPEGLFERVRRNNITMCGVLPMTLGLMIARELGAASSEIAAYATSGEASGDYERVVGYAGVIVS